MQYDGSDMMEYLWQTLDKTSDEKHIKYSPSDVEQLWWLGFVDTEKYSIEVWKQALDPYLQSNGGYLLSYDEFMSLNKYRYDGEIHVPFNAMDINEGYYTDDGLDELIEASITPSCFLSKPELRKFVEDIKTQFRSKDGLILIKGPAKSKIATLLEEHPSPLRNLEILLDDMIQQSGAEIEQEVVEKSAKVSRKEASRQTSSFSSTPTNRVEAGAKEYKNLEKSKEKEEATDDSKPKVDLKKLKRRIKGFRG